MGDIAADFLNKMSLKYCNKELQIILMRILSLVSKLKKFIEAYKHLSEEKIQAVEMLMGSPLYFIKFLQNTTINENNTVVNLGYENLKEQILALERKVNEYQQSIYTEIDKINELNLPRNVKDCIYNDLGEVINRLLFDTVNYRR